MLALRLELCSDDAGGQHLVTVILHEDLKRHLATDADETGGPLGPRAPHGLAPRIRQRRSIERFVGTLPMRQLRDCLDGVIDRRIDRHICALLQRHLTPVGENVDCDRASTPRPRQLRARQTNQALAKDDDRLIPPSARRFNAP